MDPEVVFQLAASAIASFCCGTSLFVWLLSIKALSLSRLKRDILISSQLMLGGATLLGLIASIPLVLFETKWKNDQSWPILQQEIGGVYLLLNLNEYLCVSTLQSPLTHMIYTLSLMGATAILSLSLYLSEHHNILVPSYTIISLASLSFVQAQIIRAWVICMRSWHTQTNTFKLIWLNPDLTTARHQRALWAASVSSVGLFPVLIGLTIIACIKPNLLTQILTLQIATINLRKAAVSFYIFRAPERSMDVLLSREQA